eukprot:GHRR01012790.1.p2 GENE.GHRR01012790.1~~GHRR01012790.1.p2  ORF type:complete len:189 (+),score=53.41 GHRR01012790.1:122-688(+)
MQQALLVRLVLLATGLVLVSARIDYVHVFRDDRPLVDITQAFGFGSRGNINITLWDITIWRRHDQVEADYQYGNFGFFLADMDAELYLQDFVQQKCLLDDRGFKLFTFADMKVAAVVDGKTPEFTFHFDVQGGGQFALYFANCEQQTPVSFQIRVEMYNLVGPDDRKDYLSVGETELDITYWVGPCSS